ncbi:MAG: hypothetical protein A3D16_09845 [Rhodobacterales bacterium RIFCSPHIGHO2_02_FULL_62_130]|nr:MAG: hypothetical protein A3D16_09845 [Rhodobacterales bacterium RIFCSPHIGHO2_02_FULL_62_130]OHC56313.1 MAG: hypothetical protein A3E48_20770 [Rhodobacterales bacterium RIFCSPHIGHO2_12_FULL_62_75]
MKLDPIFATEARAAALLDMKATELREQVAAGNLPPPKRIGQLERFDVDELRRVIRGDVAGGGAMQW